MPREKYETPSEYAQRLGKSLPDEKEPLNEITDLYIDARYGEHVIEEKSIDKANNIWRTLSSIFVGKDEPA
jgi:hypothetical protein